MERAGTKKNVENYRLLGVPADVLLPLVVRARPPEAPPDIRPQLRAIAQALRAGLRAMEELETMWHRADDVAGAPQQPATTGGTVHRPDAGQQGLRPIQGRADPSTRQRLIIETAAPTQQTHPPKSPASGR